MFRVGAWQPDGAAAGRSFVQAQASYKCAQRSCSALQRAIVSSGASSPFSSRGAPDGRGARSVPPGTGDRPVPKKDCLHARCGK
ncbi:hypothetical protein MTO96_016004 [Rhipicephalus appendiculatus]